MPLIHVFRHVPHEGLGTIAPALKRAGWRAKIIDVWKPGFIAPAASSMRALIVMGGPMGVYEQDRYPFLKKELALMKRMVSAGKPVLGVCLGSQLLAAALGRRVYPNERKEIGWYKVKLTPAGKRDPLFHDLPSEPQVFQWHGDTFDLPRGAALLATSPLCRNQAFRIGQRAWGLQFHLETDPPMIRDWLGQPGTDRELHNAGVREAAIRAGLRARWPRMKPSAEKTFSAFAKILG